MLKGATGRRLDRLRAADAGEPHRLRNADSRRAAAKLLLPSVKDRATVKHFAALVAKDDARLAAALKKSKADAIRNSRAVQKVLTAQAAARVKALRGLVADPADVGSAHYELLNEPFLIWPTNSVDLEASEIVPSNSWAKFSWCKSRTSGSRPPAGARWVPSTPATSSAVMTCATR
jgi:hypothetical protein